MADSQKPCSPERDRRRTRDVTLSYRQECHVSVAFGVYCLVWYAAFTKLTLETGNYCNGDEKKNENEGDTNGTPTGQGTEASWQSQVLLSTSRA